MNAYVRLIFESLKTSHSALNLYTHNEGIEKNDYIELNNKTIPVYESELWTAKQRAGSSIHEVSYRACFKSQLPKFFVSALTKEGDWVYDPFSGRGTTAIESALLGRRVIANDVNPLSKILLEPRLSVPTSKEVEDRLSLLKFDRNLKDDIDLSMFYHKKTEIEILSLRKYLSEKLSGGKEDAIDKWIRMVATNRLTGHSPGFFSVYSLPPNQAISPERQKIINTKLGQTPAYKAIIPLILKKSSQLLAGLNHFDIQNLRASARSKILLNHDARHTPEIYNNQVKLTVTSPPFLDIVQYAQDNWLRCWFNEIDSKQVSQSITMAKTIQQWSDIMRDVFCELFRITIPGGWVAFEVGEVKKGSIKLDELVIPLGEEVGFNCVGILINSQKFTKTSNIWGIKNNAIGTNTNRIVLFRKS
ncbi:MAG: site-specific DNA-methyltransferase [Pseudomonadota bacterium]|nr:site-specific DNA-methyltransferase [Pseudomonadota bacterium]